MQVNIEHMIDSRLIRIIGTLAAMAFLAVPRALGFTAIVAFGDSYTDTGRSPSSPPDYYDGRFSNGRLWIEVNIQSEPDLATFAISVCKKLRSKEEIHEKRTGDHGIEGEPMDSVT